MRKSKKTIKNDNNYAIPYYRFSSYKEYVGACI